MRVILRVLKTVFTYGVRAKHSSVVCFNSAAKQLRREGTGPLFGVRVSEADAPEESRPFVKRL
jgi:hypothetical protein